MSRYNDCTYQQPRYLAWPIHTITILTIFTTIRSLPGSISTMDEHIDRSPGMNMAITMTMLRMRVNVHCDVHSY